MAENPYAPPVATEDDLPDAGPRWQVVDRILMVRPGAMLPRIDLMTGTLDGDLIPCAWVLRRGSDPFRYYASRKFSLAQGRFISRLLPVLRLLFASTLVIYGSAILGWIFKGLDFAHPLWLLVILPLIFTTIRMRFGTRPALLRTVDGWTHFMNVHPQALAWLASQPESSRTGPPRTKTMRVRRMHIARFPLWQLIQPKALLRPLQLIVTILTYYRKPEALEIDRPAYREAESLDNGALPTALTDLASPWTAPESGVPWTLLAAKRAETPRGGWLLEYLELASADLSHLLLIQSTTITFQGITNVQVTSTLQSWLEETDATVVTSDSRLTVTSPPRIESRHSGKKGQGLWQDHLAHLGGRPCRRWPDQAAMLDRLRRFHDEFQAVRESQGYEAPEREIAVPLPPPLH